MLSKKNLSNYYNNYLKTMKILGKINKLNENKKQTGIIWWRAGYKKKV